MELRHLRYFLAVAEELHFSRAAERLNIEQPPVSRAIKDLEVELGAQLFCRNRRGTRLTKAGQVFLTDVRRLFADLEQARENVQAVTSGHESVLRIAVSDGAFEPRLSALLARSREQEPEVDVHVVEVSLAEQLRGLLEGTFDAGFARSHETVDGVVATPLWDDPLIIVVPTRHPILSHRQVPLWELIRYPLLGCHPQICEGCHRQLEQLFQDLDDAPRISGYVTSLSMLLTLVAAGYGLGFTTPTQMGIYCYPDVVTRPLASDNATLTTYLLRREANDSEQLQRFIARLRED